MRNPHNSTPDLEAADPGIRTLREISLDCQFWDFPLAAINQSFRFSAIIR
jgi:hypothetical protein